MGEYLRDQTGQEPHGHQGVSQFYYSPEKSTTPMNTNCSARSKKEEAKDAFNRYDVQ